MSEFPTLGNLLFSSQFDSSFRKSVTNVIMGEAALVYSKPHYFGLVFKYSNPLQSRREISIFHIEISLVMVERISTRSAASLSPLTIQSPLSSLICISPIALCGRFDLSPYRSAVVSHNDRSIRVSKVSMWHTHVLAVQPYPQALFMAHSLSRYLDNYSALYSTLGVSVSGHRSTLPPPRRWCRTNQTRRNETEYVYRCVYFIKVIAYAWGYLGWVRIQSSKHWKYLGLSGRGLACSGRKVMPIRFP